MLAATLTLAKSASVAFACATAAHPPSSLNPESRNSLTHNSAHLGSPSSDDHKGSSKSLSGFRMPTITVTTLLRVGFPLTDSRRRPPSSTTEYTPVDESSPSTYRLLNLSKLN